MLVRGSIIAAMIILSMPLAAESAFAISSTPDKVLTLGQYTWHVRSGHGGPGPNNWEQANAEQVVSNSVRLKLTQTKANWYSAEIYTTVPLGYGTYEFTIDGPIDRLDPNVVFGMFSYGDLPYFNEIDIEFAKWGNNSFPIGNYTVWPDPAAPMSDQQGTTFDFWHKGQVSKHRYTWTPKGITFLSLVNQRIVAVWSLTDPAFIPKTPMPVHINLYLFKGESPLDGQEVSVTITDFTYTPA